MNVHTYTFVLVAISYFHHLQSVAVCNVGTINDKKSDNIPHVPTYKINNFSQNSRSHQSLTYCVVFVSINSTCFHKPIIRVCCLPSQQIPATNQLKLTDECDRCDALLTNEGLTDILTA